MARCCNSASCCSCSSAAAPYLCRSTMSITSSTSAASAATTAPGLLRPAPSAAAARAPRTAQALTAKIAVHSGPIEACSAGAGGTWRPAEASPDGRTGTGADGSRLDGPVPDAPVPDGPAPDPPWEAGPGLTGGVLFGPVPVAPGPGDRKDEPIRDSETGAGGSGNGTGEEEGERDSEGERAMATFTDRAGPGRTTRNGSSRLPALPPDEADWSAHLAPGGTRFPVQAAVSYGYAGTRNKRRSQIRLASPLSVADSGNNFTNCANIRKSATDPAPTAIPADCLPSRSVSSWR